MNKEPTLAADDESTENGDESLHQAIDALEGMLDGSSVSSPNEAENFTLAADDNTANNEGELPLLQDIVMPGDPNLEASDGSWNERRGSPEIAEIRKQVRQRLASEIEVIVQCGFESALQDISKEILTRLEQHLDIVLPEILDEILPRDGLMPQSSGTSESGTLPTDTTKTPRNG